MPLARIDISEDAPPERIKVVSEAIYSAMVEIANVPLHDKFQVVTRHPADEIIYPKEGYLGLTYTGDLILIQITWVAGRSTEVKKKFWLHGQATTAMLSWENQENPYLVTRRQRPVVEPNHRIARCNPCICRR